MNAADLLHRARWTGAVPFVAPGDVAAWLGVSSRKVADLIRKDIPLHRFMDPDGYLHPIGVLWVTVYMSDAMGSVEFRRQAADLVSNWLAGQLAPPLPGEEDELQAALEIIARLDPKDRGRQLEQLQERTGASRATLYRKLDRLRSGDDLTDRRGDAQRARAVRERGPVWDAVEAQLRAGKKPHVIVDELQVSRSLVARVRKARFAPTGPLL